MTDNWGCEHDLFTVSPFGGPQTLNELVEGIASRKANGGDAVSFAASTKDVQVVPCIIRRKPFAPKILKKKSTLKITSNEGSLKHVTFEVEQLLAREGNVQDRNVAREKLVVSLGGDMPKGKAINYKLFKEQQKIDGSSKAEVRKQVVPHLNGKKKKKNK